MPDCPQRLRIELLGPLRAWLGETPLNLGPPRQQAVLAGLLLRPNVTVSQEELRDGLWDGKQPGSNVIPVYVGRLRRCLADEDHSVIVSDSGGYRFVSRDVEFDVARMEEIAAGAHAAERAGDQAAAVAAYACALALFRGEPLAGLPGRYAQGQRRRLAERRIALLREKTERQLRLGRYDEVTGELTAEVAADPPREALAALLMRALYGSGRQAEALAVFTEVRDRLVDVWGMDPDKELRQVHEAVLRGDDARLGVVRPKAVRRVRNELPADVGELAGRDRELARLTEPAEAGLVSVDALDGVAGAGKSTLAIRAAQLLRERYPDGSLFVDLHGHTEGREPMAPEWALRRLLRVVGVDDNDVPDDLDELAASWRAATASLRLLLVLDNAASAGQVRPLLPAGPGSRVLVTSRRRLTGLDADRRVTLGPLGHDAAKRLLSRIVGGPRADGEPESVSEVARLCGRLPLALRIAAARLQSRPMWTFSDLVARMADDERRLGELTAEDRSVEAALKLSYDQLPAAERRTFRVLGLSPTPEFDGLTVAALLACPLPDAERALENLVDASLLQAPATGRYRLHDLVAVYARRLAGTELTAPAVQAARTRVLRLYLAAARHASDEGITNFPTGPELAATPFTGWRDATAWLDTAGDFAEVVGHAAESGLPDYACWIAEALVDYLIRHERYHECRAALEIARRVADRATDRRMISSLRFCLGLAYGMAGHFEQARAWFTDALRSTGHRREEARALCGLRIVDAMTGRHAEAFAGLTEVVTLAGELADHWLEERALSTLGLLHHRQGRHAEALDCLARCYVLGQKLGSPGRVGRTLCYLGSIYLVLGRPAEAAAALRRAADLAEQVADVFLHASCLTRLGTAEQELGSLDTALDLHHRALATITDQTYAKLEPEIRQRLGDCYLAAGDFTGAHEQFARVDELTGARRESV